MSHPYHHAVSSTKKWGGKPEDYVPIHSWFDESKSHLADVRHRALRHHSQGIFEAERVFGVTITNSAGKVVPVRAIGEQHVTEDCGTIPTLHDWLKNIQLQDWMHREVKKLSKTLTLVPDDAACVVGTAENEEYANDR